MKDHLDLTFGGVVKKHRAQLSHDNDFLQIIINYIKALSSTINKGAPYLHS